MDTTSEIKGFEANPTEKRQKRSKKILISSCVLASAACAALLIYRYTDGWKWGHTRYVENHDYVKGRFCGIEGNRYLFDDEGNVLTGIQSFDGETYDLGDDGIMLTGMQNVNGSLHYFNPDGTELRGYGLIGGKMYYFREDTGEMKTGWKEDPDASMRYFDPSGQMVTGWNYIHGARTFFNDHGILQRGWHEEDGNTYYLDQYGSPLTGLQTIDDETYFFSDSGIRQNGWIEEDDEKRYFDPDSSVMETGLQEIDDDTYLFDEDGIMQTGMQDVDDETYFFSDDGAQQTGWQEADGEERYFSEDDGSLASGLTKIDGETYYLSDEGTTESEGWHDGYYVTDDGTIATNTEIDGKYVGSNGKEVSLDGSLGSAGRLFIPAEGISVPLYHCTFWVEDGSADVAQSIANRNNSACYNGSSYAQPVICDHYNQNNFTNIRKAKGDLAYIKTGSGTRTYRCTGVWSGRNTGSDLVRSDGVSILTTSVGDLVMYTCQGADWHNIYIAVWDRT